jgi:hypothetical protein
MYASADVNCICASAQFQADAAMCITENCPEELEEAVSLQLEQCSAGKDFSRISIEG